MHHILLQKSWEIIKLSNKSMKRNETVPQKKVWQKPEVEIISQAIYGGGPNLSYYEAGGGIVRGQNPPHSGILPASGGYVNYVS